MIRPPDYEQGELEKLIIPDGQPDLVICLGTPYVRTSGWGVFACDDLESTYEELKNEGVEFSKPPTREHYGYEAVFKDNSGNWFSLVEEV